MDVRWYVVTIFRGRTTVRRRFAQLDRDVVDQAVANQRMHRERVRLIVANLFRIRFDDVAWGLVRFTLLPEFDEDDHLEPRPLQR